MLLKIIRILYRSRKRSKSSETIEQMRDRRKIAYDKKMEKEEKSDPGIRDFLAFKHAFVSYAMDRVELAGFKFVSDEIQTNALGLHYPQDSLLRDVRSKSGLYALIHGDSPQWIKPNKKKTKGIELPALELLNRYRDLKFFLMEEKYMYFKHIFDAFDGELLSKAYKRERAYLAADKELGLYWYVVFSYLGDAKAQDALEQISHFDWNMINGAQEYFKRDEHLNIRNYDEKIRFLERFTKGE